jgi:hypothetical protein
MGVYAGANAAAALWQLLRDFMGRSVALEARSAARRVIRSARVLDKMRRVERPALLSEGGCA